MVRDSSDINMSGISAHIVEVFSSLQGEGLYAGIPMTFVRFGRCSMGCRYCDTPAGLCQGEECRVESPPRSQGFEVLENPIMVTKLTEIMEPFDDEFVSVTGGEPLEQVGFLAEWLPAVYPHRRVLLETNGILHREIERVIQHVNVVSMDIKPPSSTGRRARWKEHEAFLRTVVAAGREIYVKLVVTEETTDSDIQRSIGIVTDVNKYIPMVIQPAAETLTFRCRISEERLRSLERLCSAYLDDVRIMPQMHKQWGVL